MTKIALLALVTAPLLSYAQHNAGPKGNTGETVKAAPAAKATATLESKNKSTVKGTVNFTENASGGLDIHYTLEGLKKNQNHGFHIHEKGDCSSADGKSAGTHYMKVGETGGTSTDTPAKFAGDLPQIKADKNGKAEGTITVTGLTVDKNNPIDGRAIIVHGGPDDPSKASAPRVACGVIHKN